MSNTPYEPPPEGYRWSWVPSREVPSDLEWEIVTSGDAKRCRYTDHGARCPDRSVVRLNRGTDRPRWWHYCERHMLGRRLRDGVVETCILTPEGDALTDAVFDQR